MARRISTTLIDAKTALNEVGTVGVSDSAQLAECAFHVEFDGTSAAGVVLIETASSPTYGGTWATLATITWAAASRSHYAAITGVFMCIRARISSAVTSGTVTVKFVGNSY